MEHAQNYEKQWENIVIFFVKLSQNIFKSFDVLNICDFRRNIENYAWNLKNSVRAKGQNYNLTIALWKEMQK